MNKSFAPLDRRSTWDEVRSAMSISSQDDFAVGDCDDMCDVDTDFSRVAPDLCENDMWLSIARAIPYSKSN
jgi:hypothetical protein